MIGRRKWHGIHLRGKEEGKDEDERIGRIMRGLREKKYSIEENATGSR